LGGPRRFTVVLILLTAVACTRGESPKGDVKGGDGVLRLSLPGEPKSLNPNTEPLDELAMFVGENIFSKLVARADDGTVLPGVAERWTEAADGRSYTFYIRPGIRFHDGTPLTAEDVRATFAHIGESANPDLAEHIAGVDVDAGKSVTIHLKAPWAAFLPTLAWFGASILPAHVYGGGPWRGNPANMKPIGSGPFRFKTWEPGHRIVLEKFPQYFGQGPYVDEVEYLIVPNTANSVRLLQEGRIDTMIGRPPGDLVAELLRFPHRLAVLEGTPDLSEQVVEDHGLQHVVHRALPERLDRGVDARVGGHQDDDGLRAHLAGALEDRQAVGTRHAQVGHDRAEVVHLERREGRGAVGGRFDAVARVAQHLGEARPDARFVVGDEDRVHRVAS